MFYKYGGKQLYYFNTYDGASDEQGEDTPLEESEMVDGEECDACTI